MGGWWEMRLQSLYRGIWYIKRGWQVCQGMIGFKGLSRELAASVKYY